MGSKVENRKNQGSKHEHAKIVREFSRWLMEGQTGRFSEKKNHWRSLK